MSQILPNDSFLLQELLNKVLLYRLTRNLDKELQNRKISHAELSGSTGRKNNWFNRTFNELEDMRISTFIKSLAAINKIISNTSKFSPVEVQAVIDEEILNIASVIIDLSMNDVRYLLNNDPDLPKFFEDIKFYVDSLRALKNVLSLEESDAYDRVLNRINSEGN
ncbi:hypothetical protein [Risungbinella massiliensis]|uniref:hypothetical protein n=1 Tax=Risungbinella massiliensis TaxID=1329796 RepID=UPI0005CBBFCF|nr:hypothetical protein [Risungbinella massiliensis]